MEDSTVQGTYSFQLGEPALVGGLTARNGFYLVLTVTEPKTDVDDRPRRTNSLPACGLCSLESAEAPDRLPEQRRCAPWSGLLGLLAGRIDVIPIGMFESRQPIERVLPFDNHTAIQSGWQGLIV